MLSNSDKLSPITHRGQTTIVSKEEEEKVRLESLTSLTL
jgi:hypothetical protein